MIPMRGMVTAPHYLASEAGLGVLRDGGNAVEAAVAMAAVLVVVCPHLNGMGGDGYWLIAEPDGETWAVNASGSGRGVAGAVSGWAVALDNAGGGLSRTRLLRDAIHHARSGVSVTAGAALAARGRLAVPLAGEVLVQTALADTLERLAKAGWQDFYAGSLGNDVAADLAAAGVAVTAGDLAVYRAVQTTPLCARIRDANLYGGADADAVLTVALFDRLGAIEADGFDHVHGLVEAGKQALSLSESGDGHDRHALERAAGRISLRHAKGDAHALSDGESAWCAACDADGRVASVAQSSGSAFGLGVLLPRTGIVWHDRVAESPLSALLARFDDGRVMACGAGGAEVLAAIFTRYARFGIDLHEALAAPRWRRGDGGALRMEDRFDAALYEALNRAGHSVEPVEPVSAAMGQGGALLRHPDGLLEAACDPRGDGAAVGW